MNALNNFVAQRYSRKGLWSLFLMCAFPLHLWTLILVFRDMDWVIERTNVWDAVGVFSYGMLFALIESIIVFLVVILVGLFTPKQWEPAKRIGFLSLLVLITSAWAMIAQLLSLWEISLPVSLVRLMIDSHHPVRMLYVLLLVIVTPTVFFPLFSFVRSSKMVRVMQEVIERFSTLTLFYLIFDLVGITVVIVRNVL